MRKPPLLVPILTLVALLGAGCGSASTGPGQQAAAATATPAPTALPADTSIPDAFHGTWTAETSGSAASGGTWSMRISTDDLELRNPRDTSDAAFFSIHPYAATDAGVSFHADADCQPASYRWALEGDTLKFTAIEDPCIDRHDVLTSSPWLRSP